MKPNKPRCEKCGNKDIATRYHLNSGKCLYEDLCRDFEGEHLHYHCRTCSYDWTGPVLPKSVKDRPEPIKPWILANALQDTVHQPPKKSHIVKATKAVKGPKK